jgi:ribosomal protein S17E
MRNVIAGYATREMKREEWIPHKHEE